MATIVAAAGGGTWDASTTTTWVGGVAPTAADDVQLNATSGNVTIASGAVCRSLDCTGYTGTLTHNASTNLTIGDGTAGLGNIALKLVAGMTYSVTSSAQAMIFNSTSGTQQTIDTGGKTTGNFTFQGSGSSYLLNSGITQVSTTTTLILSRGTLNFNGQTCSLGIFSSTNTNTRTITFGAAAITLNGASTNVWDTSTTTNLTMTANTATLTFAGAGALLASGNLNFNGTSVTFNGTGTCGISNTATTKWFANVTRATISGGVFQVSGNVVCSGTFTCAGTDAGSGRAIIFSNSPGTGTWISAATYSISNTDFRDIALSGAGLTVGGTNILFAADSDLEDEGIGTWVARGTGFTVLSDFDTYYAGGCSLKVNAATATQTDWGATTKAYPVSPSTQYSAQARVLTTAGKTIQLRFLEYSSTLTFIQATDVSTDVTATGGWDLVSGTVTTNGSTAFVLILVAPGDALQGTFSYYVDNVQLEAGASVSAWGQGTYALNLSALSCGNQGGNAGITFPTGLTLYWYQNTGNYNDVTKWFLGTGGTGGAGRVPLAHDDVVFDANSFSSASQTVTANCIRLGRNVSLANVTNSPSFTPSVQLQFMGSFALASSVTTLMSTGTVFLGRKRYTITSAGKSFGGAITFQGYGGKYTLLDALTNTSGGVSHTCGEIDDGGFNFTATVYFGSNSNPRILTLGSTTMTLTATTGSTWNMSTSTNFTFTPGSSTVYLSGSGATARTWIATNVTFNNVRWGTSPGGVTPTTSFTCNNLQIDTPCPIVQTVATTITLSSLTAVGTATDLISWVSSSSGTQANVSCASGTIACDYLSLRDSNATGGATFYAGSHSTDVSGNTGWIFADAPDGGGVYALKERVFGCILS